MSTKLTPERNIIEECTQLPGGCNASASYWGLTAAHDGGTISTAIYCAMDPVFTIEGILLIRLWDYDNTVSNNKGDYLVGIRYTITMSILSPLSFDLVLGIWRLPTHNLAYRRLMLLIVGMLEHAQAHKAHGPEADICLNFPY